MNDRKGKIIDALLGRENKKEWCSHKLIRKRIAEYNNMKLDDVPYSLSDSLMGLVKDGYIQRANMPDHLKEKYGVAYIYKCTNKPYVDKAYTWLNNTKHVVLDPDKFIKGKEIWVRNAKLPKWFRDMMH